MGVLNRVRIAQNRCDDTPTARKYCSQLELAGAVSSLVDLSKRKIITRNCALIEVIET